MHLADPFKKSNACVSSVYVFPRNQTITLALLGHAVPVKLHKYYTGNKVTFQRGQSKLANISMTS